MECPTCTFQNTPGTGACVRCTTRLDLDGVDFIPPRASSGRAGRQVRGAAQNARFAVMSALGDVGRSLRLPEAAGVTWRQLGLAVVPGLPQIRAENMGLRLLGWLVLGAWVTVGVLGLATIGTGFSTLCGFGCVSIHCFSISLVTTPQLQGTPLLYRLVMGVGVYLMVLLGVYWPASVAVGRVVRVLPIVNLRAASALENGDVLLYTGPWARPGRWERGELVVTAVGGQNFGHAYLAEGFNMDRVVGVPGDVVKIEGGC